MATYLKRTSKLFDLTLPQSSSEMNLRDLICPVCRGILIEPVTLPCTHNLCLKCLKGTFEHNSLSCPLCRVRVGSWLRTASKSESLVNNDLWEHIRSKFPKEIEGKAIDDVPEIRNQDEYVPKLLNNPGDIQREYQFQLQKASEEMRKQRENERIANEEIIRKIQHQENIQQKQKLAQLAQDQLLARSLAKKKLIDKEKTIKYYNDYLRSSPSKESKILASNDRLPATTIEPKTEVSNLNHENIVYFKEKKSTDLRKPNLSIISKIQAERVAGGVKPLILSRPQDAKSCCDHSASLQDYMSVKNQALIMQTGFIGAFNLNFGPSCSNSMKIYGQRSEDELRIPSDALTSKKNIEVIPVINSNDDKRIESPQSAGSHDSINPEIHHFKPIKALPRTPLKVSQDGRQIDMMVIRVMPVLKKILNPVLKAPASASMKRITRCSWSAFREFIVIGKAQQESKLSNCNPVSKSSENFLVTSDTSKKVDIATDSLCDTNKNYAENINRLVNGTKTNRKTISNDETEASKLNKSQAQVKNGALSSSKSCKSRKKNSIKETADSKETFMNFPTTTMNSVAMCSKELSERQRKENDDSNNDGLGAIENIAERIKRRKLTSDVNKKNHLTNEKVRTIEKPMRSRITDKKNAAGCIDDTEEKKLNKSKRKKVLDPSLSIKRQKIQSQNDSVEKVDLSIDKKADSNKKSTRLTRNSMKSTRVDEKEDENFDRDHDERVVQEQERMERILLQEKQDYELAQRLQAEFNEMERISGRTRGSRRALERSAVTVSVEKSNVNGKISAKKVIASKGIVKSRRRRYN
ncbi:uncharacterized protein [Chelonus insularis]|uniref:uncharacterized protein n=1 Tax=Chelonus insularis TaxID=460826 RepID=UPI00158C55C5|nr:uncharacterized protein LOC118064606 [Chelonus insularis]